MLCATAMCNFSTSEAQKMARSREFFHILTCNYAPRHSGVPFFRIVSGKKKYPRCGVLYILSCKCACATAKCNFSTSKLQKLARTHQVVFDFESKISFTTAACHCSTAELPRLLGSCGVSCILTCACTSRHSGAPFFLSAEGLLPHPPL